MSRSPLCSSLVAIAFINAALSFNELFLRVDGADTTMTQKEADLLNFFCEHADSALRREDILTHIWGKNDYFLGRSMDVFITRLRKLLKNADAVSLETIHQVGFRLNTKHAL